METARDALWGAFSGLVPKVVPTFTFSRSVRRVRAVKSLLYRCQAAAFSGGVVLATPASVKSLVLRFVELCVRESTTDASPTQRASRLAMLDAMQRVR